MAEAIVLIPAHNEAPRIAPVVRGALRHLPVLVVDDGSVDGTAAVAREAGADVLRSAENRGKGEALRGGFREALARGAGAALTLDGDGQHDPTEIPAFLLARRRSGADLVVGARDFRAMPAPRRAANTLGRALLRWVTGRDLEDNQSGYRLVSRRLMEVMLEEGREPGFGFEVETVVECARRGWPIAWVPIRTIYGEELSHINPITHVGRFLRLAWRLRRGADLESGPGSAS